MLDSRKYFEMTQWRRFSERAPLFRFQRAIVKSGDDVSLQAGGLDRIPQSMGGGTKAT